MIASLIPTAPLPARAGEAANQFTQMSASGLDSADEAACAYGDAVSEADVAAQRRSFRLRP
jgi:hypothetical protein